MENFGWDLPAGVSQDDIDEAVGAGDAPALLIEAGDPFSMSEDLGRGIVAELDPATGTLTLLDSARSVTLEPTQVWHLGSFIEQHKLVWGEHASNQLIAAMEGD